MHSLAYCDSNMIINRSTRTHVFECCWSLREMMACIGLRGKLYWYTCRIFATWTSWLIDNGVLNDRIYHYSRIVCISWVFLFYFNSTLCKNGLVWYFSFTYWARAWHKISDGTWLFLWDLKKQQRHQIVSTFKQEHGTPCNMETFTSVLMYWFLLQKKLYNYLLARGNTATVYCIVDHIHLLG